MAHIHLEDGALSPEWVLFWWAIAASIIALALYSIRRERVPVRKLTIGAMCAAVGIAAFMITIPVFGGVHLNLTPLIGILAGPAVGSVSVLVMNLFSAAVGHGGWGVIGVNAVVNMAEVMIGYYAYKSIRGKLRVGRFVSGFSATTAALVITALAVVVMIAVAGIQESHLEEEETAQYIRHRLDVAGSDGTVAFYPDAVRAVHKYSKGIPRLINAVCDNALLAGYVEQQKAIDLKCVKRAIAQLEGS